MKLTADYREKKTYTSYVHNPISFNLWEKYGKSRIYLNRGERSGRQDGYFDLQENKWVGTPAKCHCYDDEIADFMKNCVEE